VTVLDEFSKKKTLTNRLDVQSIDALMSLNVPALQQ
jgi:hypothetical protein